MENESKKQAENTDSSNEKLLLSDVIVMLPSLKEIKKAAREYRNNSRVQMYVEEKAFLEGIAFLRNKLLGN